MKYALIRYNYWELMDWLVYDTHEKAYAEMKKEFDGFCGDCGDELYGDEIDLYSASADNENDYDYWQIFEVNSDNFEFEQDRVLIHFDWNRGNGEISWFKNYNDAFEAMKKAFIAEAHARGDDVQELEFMSKCALVGHCEGIDHWYIV